MKDIEHRLQVSAVKWFRLQHPSVLIFAIPNGGHRNVVVAKKLKDEGVVAGVADLCVLCPNSDGYNGLFIEMKTAKGKQTDSQKEFEKYCWGQGYKYEVCHSFDEFRVAVENYLL